MGPLDCANEAFSDSGCSHLHLSPSQNCSGNTALESMRFLGGGEDGRSHLLLSLSAKRFGRTWIKLGNGTCCVEAGCNHFLLSSSKKKLGNGANEVGKLVAAVVWGEGTSQHVLLSMSENMLVKTGTELGACCNELEACSSHFWLSFCRSFSLRFFLAVSEQLTSQTQDSYVSQRVLARQA